jgi:hypothetical protein
VWRILETEDKKTLSCPLIPFWFRWKSLGSDVKSSVYMDKFEYTVEFCYLKVHGTQWCLYQLFWWDQSMDTIAFFYLQSQEFSKWHIFFKKELADYIWKIHFPLFYYWILPDQTYNNCVTVLWILLKHCNCNDLYIYLKNTAVIKKYFTSIKYIFICSNVN